MFMKRSYFYITALLILGVAVVWILTKDHGRTISSRVTDFAVDEPERLDRIVLEKGERRLELNREEGKWLLNLMFEARTDAIEQLFKALRRIRVKSPSPLSLQDELDKGFADSSIKVDLHRGRRKKRYYVYDHVQDSQGYMMMEGSDQSFAVEVHGYEGKLSDLFVVDEGYWRPNMLFQINPRSIESVSVEYGENNEHSFFLKIRERNDYKLSLPSGDIVENVNDSLVSVFLSNFYYVPFQRFADSEEKQLADSLAASEPAYTITVAGDDDYKRKVDLYRVVRSVDETSGEVKTDPFILYGFTGNGEDMVIVRYTDVDLILRRGGYFTGG